MITVAKILKTDLTGSESVFTKPFVNIDDPEITKIFIFLEQTKEEPLLLGNNTKVIYSPHQGMKNKNKQAEWLAGVLKANNVDVIHCDQHSTTVVCVKAKKLAKTPCLISQMHGMNMCRGFSRKLFYLLNAQHIDKMIGCSDVMCDDIIKTFPRLDKNKVICIENGIDVDKYSQVITDQQKLELRSSIGVKADEQMIICTARMSPIKGIDVLIEAFAELLPLYPKLKLILAGGGRKEIRDEYEQLCQRLNISDKVQFLGLRDDIPILLHSADLFCLPSRAEGFCMSFVEAALAGLPLVISTAGIGEQLVGGISPNLLINNVSKEEVLLGLGGALELSVSEQQALSADLINYVMNHFSFKRMSGRLVHTYINIIKNGNRV